MGLDPNAVAKPMEKVVTEAASTRRFRAAESTSSAGVPTTAAAVPAAFDSK
ncbi:MAG: hypothetical protein R2706_16730 [Acidimicrobiales bacterium]